MIKALIVLNGPNGNMEFEVGKKAGSHPERAEVTEIGIATDDKFAVIFETGERWTLYCENIIVKSENV